MRNSLQDVGQYVITTPLLEQPLLGTRHPAGAELIKYTSADIFQDEPLSQYIGEILSSFEFYCKLRVIRINA